MGTIIARMLTAGVVVVISVTLAIADSVSPVPGNAAKVLQIKPTPLPPPAPLKIAQPISPAMAPLMPPDLVITHLDFSLTDKRVRITVNNMGGSRSPATTVRFDCSGDGPGGDCFARPVLLDVGPLNPGASATTEIGLLNFWKPNYAIKEVNKYYAMVDPTNTIGESNETNNLYRREISRTASSKSTGRK